MLRNSPTVWFVLMLVWTLILDSAFAQSGYDLLGVSFGDANTGFVVGESGTILRTTDGGATWASQVSGTSSTLTDVSFIDGSTGTAVGGQTVLHTTDSGETWLNQTNSFFLHKIAFVNATTGHAIVSGTIKRTTNGGTTWTTQFTEKIVLYGIAFTDINTGKAVGYYGLVLGTTNGGSNWIPQSIEPGNDILLGVFFTDATTGTVVGRGGVVYRTTNGGSTWTNQVSGTTNNLSEVFFADSNMGTVVGTDGTILHTTNGGTTWMSQASGTTNDLSDVFFTDVNTGTVVGLGGTILRTTNAGLTWTMATVVSVEEHNGNFPSRGRLHQNYPNPFNPITNLSFSISQSSIIKFSIFDVLGRRIATLVEEKMAPGSYTREWDAKGFPSGVYFYRLDAGDFVETKKAILIR